MVRRLEVTGGERSWEVDFVAIDVETANSDLASICQVGIVGFENGRVKESWQSLIDPEDYFDEMNVAIHGIDEDTVRGAPTFPQVFDAVSPWLCGRIVACHTPFDLASVARALERYGLGRMECTWLDTARVVRRCWAECSERGYGLENVAGMLGIEYRPHDAHEDARVAGEILVQAVRKTGLTVVEWLDRVRKPIDPSRPLSSHVAMAGNPDGELYGNVVVFTGALSIPRVEAAQAAARAGCEVADSVNKHTTLLVVGDQDVGRLAGHEKSSKHRRVEELISKGKAIRILRESDFQRLIGLQA